MRDEKLMSAMRGEPSFVWAVSTANLNVASPRRASRTMGHATGKGVISARQFWRGGLDSAR